MKGPQPNSKRTQRRKNRGWKSLQESSRIHRRALRRSINSRTISGTVYEAGKKVEPKLHGGKLAVYLATAGGSIKYW